MYNKTVKKPKQQLLSKPYPIRLNFECEKAWLYLQKYGANPAYFMRLGGENAVIDKAKEFKFEESDKNLPKNLFL